ncbi:Uncharacterised protein [uncultured archaeon]|nr:Uncharacterised protein [uncultured archaeon]
MKTLQVNPQWTKGNCPGCGLTIYIDDVNKRTMHQDPLCTWYTDFCSKAKCEGKVELIEHT